MSDWRYIVIVSPRGDVVRLDEPFCKYPPSALFSLVLEGDNGHGPVTVRGSHVAVVWRSDEQRSYPGPARPAANESANALALAEAGRELAGDGVTDRAVEWLREAADA